MGVGWGEGGKEGEWKGVYFVLCFASYLRVLGMGSLAPEDDLDSLLDAALEGFVGVEGEEGPPRVAGPEAGEAGERSLGTQGRSTLALPRVKRRGGGGEGARRPNAGVGKGAEALAEASRGRMAEAERLVAEFERSQMFEGGAVRDGAAEVDDAGVAMRGGAPLSDEGDSIAASLSQLNSGLQGPSEPQPTAGAAGAAAEGMGLPGMDEAMLEELAKQFGDLGGGGVGGGDGLEGMMDAMMMQLMSKDVLYGPMKHMEARFPEWLAENPEGLDEAGLEPYRKQFACVQALVVCYDTEPDNFDKVVELMQDLQDAGQPPEVIVRELSPEGGPNLSALGIGGAGMPPGECSLM